MQNTFSNPIGILAPFEDYYRKPRQAVGGLEKRIESIIGLVKQAIQQEMPLKPYFSQYVLTILQFRFELFQQFPEFAANLDSLYDEIAQELTEWETEPRFVVLNENIGFALRTNRRILQPLLHKNIMEILDITSPWFEEWVLASVLIEFGLITEMILRHEEITITDKRINDFAELVADAAQDFGALSRMLGLVPEKKRKSPKLKIVDASIKAAEYDIAEEGIAAYWNQIKDL